MTNSNAFFLQIIRMTPPLLCIPFERNFNYNQLSRSFKQMVSSVNFLQLHI